MFRYFEVLKPISRTLLNICRYSEVLVSILKTKNPERASSLAENNLPKNFYQPYLFHISDFSTKRYNGLFYIFTVSLTALLFTIPRPSQEWFILLEPAYLGCPGKKSVKWLLLLLGVLTKQNSHPKFVNSVAIFINLILFLCISNKLN